MGTEIQFNGDLIALEALPFKKLEDIIVELKNIAKIFVYTFFTNLN